MIGITCNDGRNIPINIKRLGKTYTLRHSVYLFWTNRKFSVCLRNVVTRKLRVRSCSVSVARLFTCR